MSATEGHADEAMDAYEAHLPLHAKAGIVHAEADPAAMTLALALGRRGLGGCWPNPSVGVVIADSRDGRILAGAWTARGGRPHAETIALAAAGDAARGATVYTTLEPCSHWGRTPPCCDALVRAGVARVFYGAVDPDPRVAGQGLRRLAAHGIAVMEAPFAREARWLTLGHSLRVTRNRPFVQLKLAVDSDGMVPAGNGSPQFVTGEAARRLGHRLRAEADAIMVGAGTLAADDPDLTCRLPGLAYRSPVRVVLASRGGLPPDARLLRAAGDHPVWVVCAEGVPMPRRAELERLGVTIIAVPAGSRGRPDIAAVMAALAGAGITRLLVEGGPTLAATLLSADLIDEALIVQADAPSRGETIRPFGAAGIDAIAARPAHVRHARKRIGPDTVSIYRRTEFW